MADGSGPALPRTIADAQRLHRAGRLEEAAAIFIERSGGEEGAEALQGLGLIRLQRGDADAARPLLEAAHVLRPTPRSAHNLAACLQQLGRNEQAIALHRANLAQHPEYVGSYEALAALLQQGGDVAGAARILISLCERAEQAGHGALVEAAAGRLLALRSDQPELLHLANVLRSGGRQDLAAKLLEDVLERAPDELRVRLVLCMARLAVVHGSEAEIAERRALYARDLKVLADAVERADAPTLARAAVQIGRAKPFFLAYQGEDDRALQEVYGRILVRLASAEPAPAAPPPAAPAGRRLRVGFASAYFHLHSISKLFGGWLKGLDRSRFEVFGYYFNNVEDATSRALQSACEHWRSGSAAGAAWRQRIAADGLDALIYPEIGMDPTTVQVACHRLAPVQCASWGHPVTSGLPTVDYFLSSDLMEPADGERHYSETLVRLPNLSIDYAPLPTRAKLPRRTLGLREDAVAYVCCQSLFKYLPRYDAVFARIAGRESRAQFLFIELGNQAPTALFQRRLAAAFTAAGLDFARHCVFVPRVSSDDFPGMLAACDIYLDSIGWSGGNTTLEALTCNLPVVTHPTDLMRGCHSTAILRRIGLDAFVAPTLDDYVSLAVALAEPAERDRAVETVRAAKHRLFHDREPVRALEDFLERAVAGAADARVNHLDR